MKISSQANEGNIFRYIAFDVYIQKSIYNFGRNVFNLYICHVNYLVRTMETMTLKQPIVLHVELEDPTILQDLKRALKLMKGVGKISVKKKQDVRTLSKEEGEALVRNTLIPALQDVVEARKQGKILPDAHEIINML